MQIKVRFESRPIQRWARLFSKQTLLRAARVMGPTLVALTFAGVAHAQGMSIGENFRPMYVSRP